MLIYSINQNKKFILATSHLIRAFKPFLALIFGASHREPEAHEVAALKWPTVGVPTAGTGTFVTIICKTASSDDTFVPYFRPRRIGLRLSAVGSIPVMTQFSDVSAHVIEAQLVG